MKKHTNVAWVIAAVLMSGITSAGADERDDTGREPSRDQDPPRPHMQARGCEQIGSGLYECTFDINCWEDDVGMASVCTRVTFFSDHDIP